jgi:hypothetical protein
MADMIFPNGEPRDGNILRLELVGSWESQFLGLGRLVAFLTPRLFAEAHAVDDIGVNVVFLQRHRVEVGLKLILERAGAEPVGQHSIVALWGRCAEACAAAGASSDWETFDRAQKEFAELLNRVDPGAATFRYPVDTRNQPWKWGQVDLVKLEDVGAAFQRDLLSLVRSLAAAEPLPISEDEAMEAAEELRALIDSCRAVMRTSREIAEQFRGQGEALASLMPSSRNRASDLSREGFLELEAVVEATEPLVTRTQDLLDRVVVTYGVELAPMPPVESVGPAPRPKLFDSPAGLIETQKAQVEWLVDNIVRDLRPLADAVDAVCRRSKSWQTPTTRQIHLDATRFRSRLLRSHTP